MSLRHFALLSAALALAPLSVSAAPVVDQPAPAFTATTADGER